MIKFILFGRCVAFLKLKSKPIWILTLSLSAQAQICGSNFPTVPITNRREWVRFHINLGSIYTDDWWKRPSGQIYDHMALFIDLSQAMSATRSKPMHQIFTIQLPFVFIILTKHYWFWLKRDFKSHGEIKDPLSGCGYCCCCCCCCCCCT